MPNFLRNYGLEFFEDDVEATMGLMAYIARNGKILNGYYNCPTIFGRLGDIDIFVKTKNENNTLTVVGFDTHCGNHCIWKMKYNGIDITPNDSLPTEKLLMFTTSNDDDEFGGLVPIHILNADVLPSFLENDIFSIQMVALPLSISYYKNQEEFEKSQPTNEKGETYLVANGSLLPLHFMMNHTADNSNENNDFSSDDIVSFTATVKKLYKGFCEMDDIKEMSFIRCIAETKFGELEFDHSLSQVPEDMLDNIRVGSIISGVCVLSGDVADHEYANGFVRDFKNNYQLLRNTIVNGTVERLRPILKDTTEYISDNSQNKYVGTDEIIERIKYVYENNDKCYAHPATISSVDENAEYQVGEKCIIIGYESSEDYNAIMFLDVDHEGYVDRIKVTTNPNYHFHIEE